MIPHRDSHRAGATPRPEGQPAGAFEHAQTHPRRGNSLACMHASSRLCFCLCLKICSTFKRSFPSDEEKFHQNLYFIENLVYSPC